MNKISFTASERTKILLIGITPFIIMLIIMTIIDSMSPTLLKANSFITSFVFISSIAFIIFSLKFSYTKFDPAVVNNQIQSVKRAKVITTKFLIVAIIINAPSITFTLFANKIIVALEENLDYSTYKNIMYTIALLVDPFTLIFLVSILLVFITTYYFMKDFFMKYRQNKI